MENHYTKMRDTLQVDGFFVERAYDCTVPNWKQKGSPGREYMRKQLKQRKLSMKSPNESIGKLPSLMQNDSSYKKA